MSGAVRSTTPERPFTAADAEALGLMRMGGRPPLGRYARELVARREFIWLIPRSEMRSRAMNTMLGSAWHLLNPLLLAAVYYLVFDVILPGNRDEIHPNYAAFLVVGIMVYYFTQRTVLQGARGIVNDVKLLQNVNFPAAVLPVSAAISEALSHVYALGAMLIVVVSTGESPQWTWLLLVPLFFIQLFFNTGCAFVVSRLTVHFRDTEQFLPYVMRIGLYVSGVLFGAEIIEDATKRAIFELNPVYAFIRLTRGLILDGVVEWRFVAQATIWAAVVFVAGFIYFWRYEGEYANAA